MAPARMGADNRTMKVHGTDMNDGRDQGTRPPAGVLLLGRCALCALATLMTFALAPSAGADEPGETTQGYLLVQQALGHLAHDTSHEGMDLAMEKVQDALATEDQAGVDVTALEMAETALEAEQVDTARADLQASITQALSTLPPATGEDTGTTVVVPALDTRGGMSGSDWLFVAISLLALVSGIILAIRFRPADSVGELRQRLGEKP
jgi:hypothetical protein